MNIPVEHEPAEHIAGDRRKHPRYSLAFELRYKATKGRTVYDMGHGVTCDLSSGGVAFVSEQALPYGAIIELWIDWPVLLHEQHALRLVVHGRIVRSSQALTAVRSIRYEFRTAGAQSFRDLAAAHARAAVTPPAALAATPHT